VMAQFRILFGFIKCRKCWGMAPAISAHISPPLPRWRGVKVYTRLTAS
jgi:hypothetical protein